VRNKRAVFEFIGDVLNMEIIVRKARLSDAVDLARLYIEFWKPHKKSDPLLEFKEKLTLKNQMTAARKDIKKKSNHIFVAVKDNEVIGFIEFFIKKNDKVFKIKEYGYLNSATILKKYRRRGIAKKLYLVAAKFLKDSGIKYIKTNVYTSNKLALKAWQKIGFKTQSSIMIKII